MIGCLRSVAGRVMVLVALVVAAYAGWLWGPAVFPKIQEWLGMTGSSVEAAPAPTPELADSVVGRVQRFQSRGEARMALGSREITSVIRYAVPGLLPTGIRDPSVTLEDGRMHLRALVIRHEFPDLPDLGRILGILPDTLNVELHASLMPFGQEESALLVHGLEASRIPIPRRLIPDILRAVGRKERPGLPPEALAIPLPSGIEAAYIVTDSLILSSRS
ncbi:MAG: hypothetical protein ACQET1_08980 [Gemmatimonadota bacterium]